MAEDNLSRRIVDSLSERILGLTYPPGHRLTEEALCAEFGVSRSPVREALGRLAEVGLVEKRARLGYSVRRLDLDEVHELYDVRLLLEQAVIERVCERGMDASELDRLESYWRGLHDALPSMAERLAESDEEFHEVLARAAGHRVLRHMLQYVDQRLHFVRLSDITNPDRLRRTCIDHLDILAAVRVRDAKQAAVAMRRNVEWGRSNVEAAVKEALFRAYQSH